MTREEEFTHEGFVYANNIYIERKCELFEVKDIAYDFVQGAIYADQHPREGLVDIEKALECFNKYHKRHYGVPIYDLYLLRKAMED